MRHIYLSLLFPTLTTAYQNAFIPRTFLPSVSYTPMITMKVSRGKSKSSRGKGCTIATRNYERMKTAGRRGTKRFIDPNKIFVGNLAYSAKEEDVRNFLNENGVPDAHFVSVKIIRDWRTHESKGYGFIQFMDPIFATSALELIRNKKLLGRVVRLDQGKKKQPETVYVVKKKDIAEAKTEEELVLGNAIAEADEFYTDDMDEYTDDIFADVDDDEDDFEYDGVYEEEFLTEDDDDDKDLKNMNREKRREAAKSKKKRKKPANGFGI